MMQRERLVLCSRKAASLFGEPTTLVLSQRFAIVLFAFSTGLDADPDSLGWLVVSNAAGTAARLTFLPISLSYTRSQSSRQLSAAGRSWLHAGSVDFLTQVSEELDR